jgi:hypothetical protein
VIRFWRRAYAGAGRVVLVGRHAFVLGVVVLALVVDLMAFCVDVCLPSHGENRGSSPLGSANDFKHLVISWAPS